MPHDLQMLVWSAALAILQMFIAVFFAIPAVGLPALAGNREGLSPLAGLAGRAQRSHLNMLESLVIFAIFVIVLAAAEAAVALAIFLNYYNNFSTIDVERAQELKG